MKLIELNQIISNTPLVEKTQQSHQKMDEEAKKMFFLNLHKELMRKDKQISKPPETKETRLEEKKEKTKEERKKREKKGKSKTEGGLDIKV